MDIKLDGYLSFFNCMTERAMPKVLLVCGHHHRPHNWETNPDMPVIYIFFLSALELKDKEPCSKVDVIGWAPCKWCNFSGELSHAQTRQMPTCNTWLKVLHIHANYRLTRQWVKLVGVGFCVVSDFSCTSIAVHISWMHSNLSHLIKF